MMNEKRVTFTNGYNKRRGPSHGFGQFTYNNIGNRHQAGRDIPDTQQLTYDGATQFHPRSNWGNSPRNNTFNSGRGRPFNRYQNQFVNRNDDNDYRNGSTGALSRGNWLNIGSNPRSSGPRPIPQQNRQYQPSRSSTPDNSVFRRSNSQESGGFVPYEQRFPRTNNQSGSHAVHFTTADDSINALSDLCPLNCQVVPMIGYATIEFSYDPNGEYTFPLTVWITEMRTQNLLGMDFCQNQASGIHFALPGIELR